jgi:pleiotropic regulator 1
MEYSLQELVDWSLKKTKECSFEPFRHGDLNTSDSRIGRKVKFRCEYSHVNTCLKSVDTVDNGDDTMPLVPFKEADEKANYVSHPSWTLMRVISGHTGWVRAVTVDVSNEWFATGSVDRMIKIWDLASGKLSLSLTGHVSTVRALQSSDRHPYLFSGGEDKMVKCWDLEQNKVIRHYHGHLSAVYSLALHPALDILVTAGRDSVARVWDMRTCQPIYTLAGHSNTISSVHCQEHDPQVITSSMDSTIRLWDLRAGKTMAVLTHHKRSVRSLCLHPSEFTFASGSSDHIKKFKFPNGEFLHDFTLPSNNTPFQPTEVVNTLSINQDNVMVSGSDNGLLSFFDWSTGKCFQQLKTKVQPGSLEAEAGIFSSTFDRTGLRLITCEADKTIKIWKEQDPSPNKD